MGFQMQICSILCFSLLIIAKFFSSKEVQQVSNASLKIMYIVFTNTDCFVVDSSYLHLTFITVCLVCGLFLNNSSNNITIITITLTNQSS